MITPAELALLRAIDPDVVIPGIDTPEGNPLATSALTSYTTLSTNPNAPVYYNAKENLVVVRANGVVLNGYNFSGVAMAIVGNNATIENCTFNDMGGWYSVIQENGYSGLTVKNCTFNGGDNVNEASFIASENGFVTISNNSFINTPSHAVSVANGVISDNFFSGAGYLAGAHADAINIYGTPTGGSVAVTGNFIDWTNNSNALAGTTNAIRITTDDGNTSNVSITGNTVLGGTYSIYAEPSKILYLYPGFTGAVGTTGTLSNVNISNNFVGFAQFGAIYPTPAAGVTIANNSDFDETNPIYSSNAWAVYLAAGVPTPHLVVSTGGNVQPSAAGPTTLYGDGEAVHMYGSTTQETNFVGGFGTQFICAGAGANIFTYLAISNSTPNHYDEIGNFDSAKDVIDLGYIDADPTTAGAQSFTFIGTAAFSGGGAEVRYQQDPTKNVTYVEADLAGDSGNSSPDLFIQLSGLQTLTAANFALTSAQSSAGLAAGASLSVSATRLAGAAETFSYANVQGKPYSSYEALYTSQFTRVADDLNLSSSADELDLSGNALTVTRGATETLQSGTTSFSLARHANETIQAGVSTADTFIFGANFGQATIEGFTATGSGADTVQLATSSFSYLNAGMTQAQDLAAVLAHDCSSATGITISDSAGDSLTLAGMTASSIAASPSQFRFV